MKIFRSLYIGVSAAALALVIMAAAAALCYGKEGSVPDKDAGASLQAEGITEAVTEPAVQPGVLTLANVKTGEVIAAYDLAVGDTFSVGFIHSVNKSPLTDYYELREDGIYVVKTVYYGFGAGVQTELEEGQALTYGEDGSMIITGFDRRMDDLIYIVGTVSDHTLVINEGREDEQTVSLRELCGRNTMVRFSWGITG